MTPALDMDHQRQARRQPSAITRDCGMERLAIAAADAVGAAIAGVDVLVAADGAPTVLEVDSMPAWSGLQRVSARNVAQAIASALIETIARRPPAGAGGSREQSGGSGARAPTSRPASPSSTR